MAGFMKRREARRAFMDAAELVKILTKLQR